MQSICRDNVDLITLLIIYDWLDSSRAVTKFKKRRKTLFCVNSRGLNLATVYSQMSELQSPPG